MTFAQAMKETESSLNNNSVVLALRAGTAASGRTEGGREALHKSAGEQFAKLLAHGKRETSLPADELLMRIAQECPTLTALRRGTVPRI